VTDFVEEKEMKADTSVMIFPPVFCGVGRAGES